MTTDEHALSPKNTVVRISFTPDEMKSFELLTSITGMRKPQDILRFLLAQRIEKEKSQSLKYGSKRVNRETPEDNTPKPPTVDEIVDKAFSNPDPRMIVGWLGQVGYFPMSSIVTILSGMEYRLKFNDAELAQMPADFDKKTYICVNNRGTDIFYFPTDDEEVKTEVKQYLKEKMEQGGERAQ